MLHVPFKILSPKTNMFSTGSTSMAWKIATVATGSTADISEPKAKLSTKFTANKKNEFLEYSDELDAFRNIENCQ